MIGAGIRSKILRCMEETWKSMIDSSFASCMRATGFSGAPFIWVGRHSRSKPRGPECRGASANLACSGERM